MKGAFRISAHAKMRGREFGLYAADIVALLNTTGVEYMHNGDYICKRDKFTIVVAPDRLTVITVLLNTQERWEHKSK